MYYIVYGFVYLLSLLPFPVLYLLSDLCFFILFHVVGYRKQVVWENLKMAFPEKSDAELKKIRVSFYKNFCDTWVEVLKMVSITKKQIHKRISCNYTVLERLYEQGRPVQGFSGHFMNWEYTTVATPLNQPFTVLAPYIPLKNDAFEQIVRHARSRYGAVMLRAGKMKREIEGYLSRPYLLGLAADQSPSNPANASWLYFMNQPAGFIRNPWLKARRLNLPTVYMKVSRVKRGYYNFEVVMFDEAPALLSENEMIKKYRDLLEEDIRRQPDNYLWTHRRWKHGWKKEYSQERWIDTAAAPEVS